MQVPELHKGHCALIDAVYKKHEVTVVMLGIRDAFPNERHPLDYNTRSLMVRLAYPGVQTYPLRDIPGSDYLWSVNLDKQLGDIFGRHRKCILYASRDGFKDRYHGNHPVLRVPEAESISGTEMRKDIINFPRSTTDFRAGVIYGVSFRFPIMFSTVDVAVINPLEKMVLLGQKPEDRDKYRLIGGFVDPNDLSLEHTARREVIEETGHIEVDNFVHLGSVRVDDARYVDGCDKVMTSVFIAQYIFGNPIASDDLTGLKWFPYPNAKAVLRDMHLPLWAMVDAYLQRRVGDGA